MGQENQPTSMRTFSIVWGGQIVSILGSEMTNFATTIWAWQLTGQATPLALIVFFTHTPRVIAASFAGVLVDRWNRKQLMMIGDLAAGISTIAILLLLVTNHLEIWHLYICGAINGWFGYFQELAYSASMSAIVPQQHYVRATAIASYISYSGSAIFAPALAGTLYYIIGLHGILAIDIASFAIALATISFVHIPQPTAGDRDNISSGNIWQELTFGFRYIIKRPSLLAILVFLLSCNLVANAGSAIAAPMILAKSGNDAAAFASVQFAIGVGGLVGAVGLSIWGGPSRRIHGLLLGGALGYISSMMLGLGRIASIWMVAGFFEAFFSPFFGSCNQAIWLSKVEPQVQGRVFACRYLIAQITSPLGLAIAGPLADRIFEPAMMSGGSLAGILGGMFGTGAGAGMALQYTLLAGCGALICLGAYTFRLLRDVEDLVPDHEHS